jgi:hypothetical protein
LAATPSYESLPVLGRRPGIEDETEFSMYMSVHVLSPLIALIAGILILVMPRLLNYVVAIYLIVIGLLGILGR